MLDRVVVLPPLVPLQLLLPVHEQPGSQPAVEKPTTPGVPTACSASPHSNIAVAKGSRRGFSIRGSAGETPCRTDPAASQRLEHVAHVYVTIYRNVSHHRCRFITAQGTLTHPRSCQKPIRFTARGTSRWKLTLNFAVAPGRTPEGVLAALRERVDPVFLPRRVVLVERLPRDELGKLPRRALAALQAELEAG